MLAPGLVAPCVLSPDRRRHLQLCGDDAEQWREGHLVGREYPARMALVHHLDGQPESIVVTRVLTNVGKVAPRQGCQPDEFTLILRERE